MNHQHRLQKIIDWRAYGWFPYQPDSLPFVGQTVEVCMSNNKLSYAIYDPKWENGFCNLQQTEALTMRPVRWRATNSAMGNAINRPKLPEYDL